MTEPSTLIAPQVVTMARGEVNTISIDWGNKTAGSETGALKNGDTVTSCVVAADGTEPAGMTAPTLGAVTVNSAAQYVNRRSCAAGEATNCNVTTSATQGIGSYQLKFTATTTNGKTIPRYVRIVVEVPLLAAAR